MYTCLLFCMHGVNLFQHCSDLYYFVVQCNQVCFDKYTHLLDFIMFFVFTDRGEIEKYKLIKG